MSRLDEFINRMTSQKAGLEWAFQDIAHKTGLVFELGLGNGRTFDHMREHMPDKKIYVFERNPEPHPASMPDNEQLIIGDVRKTLNETLERFGPVADLINADLGSYSKDRNNQFAIEISPEIEPLLAPGGLMLSTDKMYFTKLVEEPLPAGVTPGRLFIYRAPV